MAMVNIPSTCNDPTYRYKMPRLITKVEGRGNAIKTCIVNMGDVARALMRPPQYTTKWLGNELGAWSTYTNKEGDGECTLVNGFHEPAVIQTFLDKFIDEYVCCKKCHLPELSMTISNSNIMGKCKACGWIGDLDSGNKLASFITKHPPDESGLNIRTSGADVGNPLSKEERRREKLRKQAKKDKDDDESTWYSDSTDDDRTTATKSKKKKDKKEKKEKKEKKGKKEKKTGKGARQGLPEEAEEAEEDVEEDAEEEGSGQGLAPREECKGGGRPCVPGEDGVAGGAGVKAGALGGRGKGRGAGAQGPAPPRGGAGPGGWWSESDEEGDSATASGSDESELEHAGSH